MNDNIWAVGGAQICHIPRSELPPLVLEDTILSPLIISTPMHPPTRFAPVAE